MESEKPPHLKKAKKKQVKDDLDRTKQAEKKRRRLEKALATSAAIRLELEKKKQLKKKEQQTLDEEGAAIAEAVALHVLLDENSDDSPRTILKERQNFGSWHHTANIELLGDGASLCHQNLNRCSVENGGWFPPMNGCGLELNLLGKFNQSFEENFHLSCLDDGACSRDDISAGLIAVQAVSSLRIGDEAQLDIPVFSDRY